MPRIFRRAANKVMNSRDGHESIGLLISDEKLVYESYQKVVMAQVDESISLLKWAKSEENLALQDVFSKAFEVSCMWTSSWRDFNHEYYKYRKTFKEVLREERVLDEERRRQAMHTTKLNRLQKQLEQTKRKGDADRCCSLANEIVEVVSQAENGQAELEVKATKLEMLKAEKLRDSMLQISVGLNQWASKTLLVAEAYSKLANLIPDTPTKVSKSKIFHGTSESRNIVNNLARDLIIDTELSQQLKYMSYVVSRPILPAQQNGVKCNHVGLNSEKMPGKVNRKPVGQKGMLPQALCHHHLRAKKMDPNFGRALSVPDLRPPPTPPPPPGRLPKEAPAQTTSKMLPDNNNNIQWYASANISSYSDSDWEEGYSKPYSDPRLAQRKMLSKAASDGAINTAIGRVYEDKDAAMCQRTEKQSEEDFSHDNDSAAYVDFTDDVERMMQSNEIVIPNGTSESRNIVNNLARDRIIDPGLSQQLKDMSHSAKSSLYAVSTPILPAQQNGVKCIHVGLNSEKMPGKVNRKPEGQKGSPQALCHHHLRPKKLDPNFGRAQSVPDLRPPPNPPPPPPGRLSKEAPAQTTSKMLPDNNNNIQWDASANISSDSDSDWEEGYSKPYSDPRLAQRKMFWKPASDGAINTVGRVYEDQDSATCQCTEKRSEEDMSHDDDSAAYVDFTGDVERMMQPNEIVARQ